MGKTKRQEITYGDRETLDAELGAAISEILSAEEEAKRIIAKAEASVKAVQLDGATRERSLRDENGKLVSSNRDRAIAEATDNAEKERARRVAEAQKSGAALVAQKKSLVEARIKELYAQIVGKAK